VKMDSAKRQKELEEENGKLKQLVADSLDKADPERYCGGKLLSPQRLAARAVEHACEQYEVSEQERAAWSGSGHRGARTKMS